MKYIRKFNSSQERDAALANVGFDVLAGVVSGGTITVEMHEAVQPNYFYVEDASGSANTLSIAKSYTNAPTIEVFSSTDGNNWTSMGNTSTTAITATVPANGKLYLKATANTWANYDEDEEEYGINSIIASGSYNVGGNIMSLLNGDNYQSSSFSSINECAFLGLFYRLGGYNTKIISAANLVLPNNTCASCYDDMFVQCTALTTAPVLPATTLARLCYYQMFSGCTSLNEVTTYANDISATNCLTNWLSGVATTGDFYNLGGATYESGASGIPSGWTVHTSL